MTEKSSQNPPKSSKSDFSPFTKGRIIALREQSKSFQKIADEVKRSKSGVYKFVKRWEANGMIENKKKPGRPKMITPRSSRRIIRLLKKSRRDPANLLTKKINEGIMIKHGVSTSTLRRHFYSKGFHARYGVRKPFI